MKVNHSSIICLCIVVASFSTTANSTLLTPDYILRLEFTYEPVFVSGLDDTFTYSYKYFDQDAVTVLIQPTTTTTHVLYDEGILLGTYAQTTGTSSGLMSAWVTPESVYASVQNPASTDLSTIEDGTESGRIDITLGSGMLDIDLASFNMQLFYGHASSSGTITSITPINLTNASIVSTVPVPAAIWLFISGLLGMAGITRRRVRI